MFEHPDTPDKILLALYAGVIHGSGFGDVYAGSMNVSKSEFNWSLYILQMRGLIEGCKFQPAGLCGRELRTQREGLLLTPKGFEKVESELESACASERLHEIAKILSADEGTRMAETICRWLW